MGDMNNAIDGVSQFTISFWMYDTFFSRNYTIPIGKYSSAAENWRVNTNGSGVMALNLSFSNTGYLSLIHI